MLYPIQNDKRNKLDLSGMWDFQTDPATRGEPEGWFEGLPAPRPIAVPGSWNEQYEDLFNYFSLAWYLKRTYVPQSWKGQRVMLRIGSACYFGTLYVNGVNVEFCRLRGRAEHYTRRRPEHEGCLHPHTYTQDGRAGAARILE